MDFKISTTFDVKGRTYKEARDAVDAITGEFLKGTRGVQVEVTLAPRSMEYTMAGQNLSDGLWVCDVVYTQKSKDKSNG